MLYSQTPNKQFLKKIVSIVKVLGNQMNKGYGNRQNASCFSLDALKKLFDTRSTDEEKRYCIFDIVMQAYLKMTSQPLSRVTIEAILNKCKHLSKHLKEVSWNSNQLREMQSRNQIVAYREQIYLDTMQEKEVLSDNALNYLIKAGQRIKYVLELSQPYHENKYLPCEDDINILNEFLGKKNTQSEMFEIQKFLEKAIEYFEKAISDNLKRNRRKVKRALSGDLQSVSPNKSKNKENISSNIISPLVENQSLCQLEHLTKHQSAFKAKIRHKKMSSNDLSLTMKSKLDKARKRYD